MTGSAALVTGGAQRLGGAMALRLARRGCAVAVHYNSSEKAAQQTVNDLRATGVPAAAVQGDLADRNIGGVIGQASAALGRPLDILINNASAFEFDTLETATADGFDAHMAVNLRAPMLLSRAFAEQVPAEGGAIINLIDQRVRKLTPKFMTYTLSKTALWTLTQTSAQGLAPNIRVNAIGPGPTLIAERQTQDHFDRQRAGTLLQRGSTPEDVVLAMDLLLDNRSMTGQLLCVDGGQHLTWQTRDIQG